MIVQGANEPGFLALRHHFCCAFAAGFALPEVYSARLEVIHVRLASNRYLAGSNDRRYVGVRHRLILHYLAHVSPQRLEFGSRFNASRSTHSRDSTSLSSLRLRS